MTQQARQHFKALCSNTRKYSPAVEKRLSKAPDSKLTEALVESAAKYYPALKKLADK